MKKKIYVVFEAFTIDGKPILRNDSAFWLEQNAKEYASTQNDIYKKANIDASYNIMPLDISDIPSEN